MQLEFFAENCLHVAITTKFLIQLEEILMKALLNY